MTQQPDYYANHRLKMRFPWRLYHGPMVEAIRSIIDASPGVDVLNVGSGPFFEFECLPQGNRHYVICDIDPRAIELARGRIGNRLAGADVVASDGALPYRDESFDVVISTEVIEHVSAPEPWLRELLRVLRCGGSLVLTTPNYASLSLRLLEATALEVLARWQGFTRKGIHPRKLDRAAMLDLLHCAGAVEINAQVISWGWVLLVRARRAPARVGSE